MRTILNFDTIHEYNTFLGIETFHPLISSIDFSKVGKEFKHIRKRYGRLTSCCSLLPRADS